MIDSRSSINIMTSDTMFILNLQGLLRHTLTILQLAGRSTMNLGVLDEVIVSIDS